MAYPNTINKEVNVNALYFKPRGGSFRSFPKRMEFEGREYTFLESGLQMLVGKGQNLVKLFEMTDGEHNFKLRFDTGEHTWTLLGIANGQRPF